MPLDLTIVTPQGQAFAGPVEGVVLPGTEGDFGVLPGHERFLSTLRIGEIQIRNGSSGQHWAAISDGFVEVSGDRVTIMVDTCELAENIDLARAERAKHEAERALAAAQRQAEEKRDFAVLEAALARAIVRIRVAQHQI